MKCDGYCVENDYKGGFITRCNGTRERDICSCEGDKSKCNFYEKVRIEGELEKKTNEVIKTNSEIFNISKELYDIVDRSLKDSSVKNIEINVQDFIHIQINRSERKIK